MTGGELASLADAVVGGGRGVRRWAEVVDNRGRTVRARDRGVTMVSLVDSVADGCLQAEIQVREPDGASWSMKLTSGSVVGQAREQ